MRQTLPVLTVALLAGCKALTPTPDGVLTGTVLVPSGSAAVGATVVVEGTVLTTVTDSQGVFTVSGLPAGTYSLRITAATPDGGTTMGLRLDEVTLSDARNGLAVGLNLDDVVLGEPGTLQGTANLSGVPATKVLAVVPGEAQTTFVGDMFRINTILPGNYQLFVYATTAQGPVFAGGPIAVNVAPLQTADVNALSLGASSFTTGSLQGQARLGGQVSSKGITVALQDPSTGASITSTTTTDDDGDYLISSAPAGLDTLTASMSGYESVSVPLVVVSGPSSAPFIALSPAGTTDAGP
jgi:hypothetical protein